MAWRTFSEGEPCFTEAFQIFAFYVARAHVLGWQFVPFEPETNPYMERDWLLLRADGGPMSPASNDSGFFLPAAEYVIALDDSSDMLAFLQGKREQPKELRCQMMVPPELRRVALPRAGIDSREPITMFGSATMANLDALEAIIDSPTTTPDEVKRHRLAVFAKMARNAAFHDNLLSFLPPKKHAPLGQWVAPWGTYTMRLDVQKVPGGSPIVHGYDAEQGGNLLDGRAFSGDYLWQLAPLLLLWDVKELLLGRYA